MILISGTAGFIGYHLANALLEEGHEVIGVDNLNSYYPVQLKRHRHDLLRKRKSFIPFEIDLCNLDALEKIYLQYKPTHVCNLAAQPGVRYSLINPFVYQKSNIEGFINIIELSKKYKVRNFVYASSSSVYGGIDNIPFSESQKVDRPLNLYAATKKSNELLAHSYSHLFGLKTVGLRFFTVYGPSSRPDMATWIFTENIFFDKPINVYNHGRMKRDFTYVDDIVKGIHAALFKDGLPDYSVINLGNNKPEDLLRLVEVIEKAVGKKGNKVMMEVQPGDMLETYADISLAKEKLGYNPSTSIEDGIMQFVEWYLANDEIAGIVRRSRNEKSL